MWRVSRIKKKILWKNKFVPIKPFYFSDNVIIGRTIDTIKPQTSIRPERRHVVDEDKKQVEEEQTDINLHRRETDSVNSRNESFHSQSDRKRETHPHRGTSRRPEIHEVVSTYNQI